MLMATWAGKRAESSTVASASVSNWAVLSSASSCDWMGKLVPQDFCGDPLVGLGGYWD